MILTANLILVNANVRVRMIMMRSAAHAARDRARGPGYTADMPDAVFDARVDLADLGNLENLENLEVRLAPPPHAR
jgi:hypothetical protein